MDFTTLYEADIETWAELQVAALRRLAVTPGPWANAIDWENVIEEVEDLRAERRRAVESLLENALVHVLKIAADPESLSVEHWREKVQEFWSQAHSKIKPAMRSRIDMQKIWERACKQASRALTVFDRSLPDGQKSCPYSLDDVFEDDFDLLRGLRMGRMPL
jgi:hypothetical protein